MEKSHPVSCKYCKAAAESKAGVTSALNAWVVSLFQADPAGYAATISQTPGVVLEGLAGIFSCVGPYRFFPLRQN